MEGKVSVHSIKDLKAAFMHLIFETRVVWNNAAFFSPGKVKGFENRKKFNDE